MHLRRHLLVILPFLFSLLSPTQSWPLENDLVLPSSRKLALKRDDSVLCLSWRFSIEVNAAGAWATVPSRCVQYVSEYMTGEVYASDSQVIAAEALEFAKSVTVAGDGKDAWVFDIDETLLSNLPYYAAHGFGYDPVSWDEWSLVGKGPALPASLSLYKELQKLGFKIFLLTGRSEPYRNATIANLKFAGYADWERLILRAAWDVGKSAVDYKSEKRQGLINEGYRINGNSGDQWSDLMGYAVANRSFKHPNPMYYIP